MDNEIQKPLKRSTRIRRIIKTPKPYKKLEHKCFYIRVTSIDGKRKEVNLGTADKKEARLRAKRKVDLLNSQLDGSFAKVIAVPRMVEAYFQSKKNWTESTRERNRQHAFYFVTFMGTRHPEVKYFNHINQMHIEAFQEYRFNETSRSGKRLSPKTIRESVGLLSNMFEWALKRNYVHANPVRKIDRVKVIDKDQHVFSDEELIAILGYCKNSKMHKHLYAPYLTLITTGLRSGELVNLVWGDIDFDRRVIKIRTKTLPDGREWTTKTKQGRELKMDNEVFDVLFELKIRSNADWVFINTKGNRLTRRMLWEHLRRICDKLEIKKGQVHSFRRTFACMMDKAVNDRVAIQQTLGHSTMAMTDRYCGYRPKEYVDKAHLKTTSEFIKKLKASK